MQSPPLSKISLYQIVIATPQVDTVPFTVFNHAVAKDIVTGFDFYGVAFAAQMIKNEMFQYVSTAAEFQFSLVPAAPFKIRFSL